MDAKRKKELLLKGAVVVWTCATPNGLAHLFYLKNLGNKRYCLMREPLLEEKEVKVTPIWIVESKEKMGLLITTITNMLRIKTVALEKHYILSIEEAIKQGGKPLSWRNKNGLSLSSSRCFRDTR